MNQHIETLETLAQQYEDVGVLHVRDSLRAAITLMREQSDWVVADHHVLKRYESHCTWVRRWCGLSYEDQTAAHEALAAYRGQSPELSVMAQMLMDDMALAIKQLAAIALMRGQSEPMPADTCPYWKRVLLWLPSMPGYAETWWIGQRCGGDSRNHGYDEQWKISTPFSQMSQTTGINQQVWVGDAPKPLYWAPLPPNMDRQKDPADEQ
jgi:hypothetical protein